MHLVPLVTRGRTRLDACIRKSTLACSLTKSAQEQRDVEARKALRRLV